MSEYQEKALNILRENGFRITNPRKLVIKLLDKSKEALSVYEIKDKLIMEKNKIDIVSIYRIVDCLEKNHLIHKILTSNKIMKCQLKKESECTKYKEHYHCHHLLICRVCGIINEIHCTGISELIKKIKDNSKFNIESHNLEFYGICSNCKS